MKGFVDMKSQPGARAWEQVGYGRNPGELKWSRGKANTQYLDLVDYATSFRFWIPLVPVASFRLLLRWQKK